MNQPELFGKCPYVTAQKVLAGKWSILILCYLKNGTLRFSELNQYMPSLTQATLAKQLRKLEEDKLIVRTVYPVVPPKVEYSLSEIGQELTAVLDALSEFGEKYIQARVEMDEDWSMDDICPEAGTGNCRCCSSFCDQREEQA